MPCFGKGREAILLLESGEYCSFWSPLPGSQGPQTSGISVKLMATRGDDMAKMKDQRKKPNREVSKAVT